MMAKKSPEAIQITTTSLQSISGSDNKDFTDILVAQVAASLWVEQSDSEQRARQIKAAITAMEGMKPRDGTQTVRS